MKMMCLRCGINKVKGYWEGGCSSWGEYYPKHIWIREEVRTMDTFRKNYTPLDEQQKAEMLAIKEKAEELEVLYGKCMQREPRLMAVAKTNLEQSVMWAVKAVTTEQRNPEQG